MQKIVTVLLLGSLTLFGATAKIDGKTGLVWQDDSAVNAIEKDYDHAKQYCEGLVLDGYSDWRLPTIREFYTIIDIARDRPALMNGFEAKIEGNFWTVTTFVQNAEKEAWSISTSYGEAESAYKSREYHVRCVRGGK